MKKIAIYLIVALFVLTGCMSKEAERESKQIPYEDQVKSVQGAIDAFRKDTNGLLPIKTKEQDTPIYEKYLIDFTKLVPKYLAEAPANSFESGGIYQYVIVDPEGNPAVKLIDLRMAETVSELQIRLQTYKEQHTYPPYKEVVGEGVFTLDFEKLGYATAPYVISPYSGKKLSFVIDKEGNVYVDYKQDLAEAIKTLQGSFEENVDIRYLLLENAAFVPAFSLPYAVQDEKVIFLDDKG